MLLPLAVAVLLAAVTAMLAKLAFTRGLWGRSAAPAPANSASPARRVPPAAAARYVPWDLAKDNTNDDVLVVDCTHSTARTLTHHKGHHNPPGIAGSDCSTGLVLDAIAAAAAAGNTAGGTAATSAAAAAVGPWLSKPLVSVNHFDADAVLSMWSYIHQEEAVQHQAVLRHAARIGDMREAGLGCTPEALAARGWDGVACDQEVHHALKLACWINTIERRRFSPPYVDKDADGKHAFFLDRLAAALTPEGIEELRQDWHEEYDQVLTGWQLLDSSRAALVQRHDDVGLVVVRPPQALHYYSAFSFAIGCDTVLTALPGNRYEVESRYTQFVCVHSRPVQARLDLGPLAKALNRVDTGREAGVEWASNSMVDTGPILRLDRGGEKLQKAERYGHPTERPHYASGLPPPVFEEVVCSYMRHGLAGRQPKAGGWGWDELQVLNAGIDWREWERAVLPAVLAGG